MGLLWPAFRVTPLEEGICQGVVLFLQIDFGAYAIVPLCGMMIVDGDSIKYSSQALKTTLCIMTTINTIIILGGGEHIFLLGQSPKLVIPPIYPLYLILKKVGF